MRDLLDNCSSNAILIKGRAGNRIAAPISDAAPFFQDVPNAKVRAIFVRVLNIPAFTGLSRPIVIARQPWMAPQEHSLLSSSLPSDYKHHGSMRSSGNVEPHGNRDCNRCR